MLLWTHILVAHFQFLNSSPVCNHGPAVLVLDWLVEGGFGAVSRHATANFGPFQSVFSWTSSASGFMAEPVNVFSKPTRYWTQPIRGPSQMTFQSNAIPAEALFAEVDSWSSKHAANRATGGWQVLLNSDDGRYGGRSLAVSIQRLDL